MLEDSVFESARRRTNRSPLTIAYSVLLHTAAIGAFVLVPLLQMQAVPIPHLEALFPPPQFIHHDRIEVDPHKPAPRGLVPEPDAIVAPTVIPSEIARIVEAPSTISIDVPRSDRGMDIRSIFSEAVKKPEETLPVAPPAAEPEPATKTEDVPLRVGGGVQQANLIHQVVPNYPPLALQARIQGVVVLDAVINKEEIIESLRVVNGHPLLIRAAIEAVQQWMYKPTLLNGEPVVVETSITVNFSFR